MFVDNITHYINDDLDLKASIQKCLAVENVGVDEHTV